MADVDVAERNKLKIFISYSRKDEAFAQELLAGLDTAGFEPYLDKHDIAAGEEWEARLGRLIEASDTVVYVISPDAVASERCAWEVERTYELSKRLLPIVFRAVDEDLVPPRLKQLNYIFFDRPLSFGSSLQALAKALKTDIGWIREHTRIGEAALRWEARGRAEELLLRGAELIAAKDWLNSQPKYAPEPTLLHHAFIKAGEDAETARSSAERQRLDQMAAAQAEREKTLAELAAALGKQRRALAAVAGLFVCIIGIAILAYTGLLDRSFLAIHARRLADIYTPSLLTVAREDALKPGDQFKECASCPEMVIIPAGEFMMGSRDGVGSEDERPQRKVVFAQAFSVSKFEVTFDEWDGCVAHGACHYIPGDNSWGRGRRPVINVNYNDIKVYLAWLSRQTQRSYRLLSEAEWEYVARAGSDTAYSWGNEIGSGLANCKDCFVQSTPQTLPVGSFAPNAFGVHDMHGNVFEWVEDCYVNSYRGAPVDGRPVMLDSCDRRVRRGGAWASPLSALRSAFRSRPEVGWRDDSNGFRVARTLAPRP